jgi:hypothetical protein
VYLGRQGGEGRIAPGFLQELAAGLDPGGVTDQRAAWFNP